MPNWCFNHVKFTGNNTRKAITLLQELEKKCQETGQGQLPSFIDPEKYFGNSYMFDINVHNDLDGKPTNSFDYQTKWAPNTEALIDIAKHFKLEFEQQYDEMGMGIYGRAFYRNGELETFDLDDATLQQIEYDEETDMYKYQGEEWESQYELIEMLLDNMIETSKTHL